MRHALPTDVPDRLNLHSPPATKSASRNYAQLVELLQQLGSALDGGPVEKDWVRAWEKKVLDLLEDGEIDMLLRPSEDSGYFQHEPPQQRWAGLRRILMRRKGLLT